MFLFRFLLVLCVRIGIGFVGGLFLFFCVCFRERLLLWFLWLGLAMLLLLRSLGLVVRLLLCVARWRVRAIVFLVLVGLFRSRLV